MPACHEEGESVVYVDDETDSVHVGHPENEKTKKITITKLVL